MRRVLLMITVLALGLGQLLNPNVLTTQAADTEIPAGDGLATLGPITLITDHYGSRLVPCTGSVLTTGVTVNTSFPTPSLGSSYSTTTAVVFGSKYEEDPDTNFTTGVVGGEASRLTPGSNRAKHARVETLFCRSRELSRTATPTRSPSRSVDATRFAVERDRLTGGM